MPHDPEFTKFGENAAEAMKVLGELRNALPYHGRGWWLLNNAFGHVDNGFWKAAEELKKRETPRGRRVCINRRALTQ